MFVALGIQHAMRMCHTVICCLPNTTIFFHIISYTRFRGEKNYWAKKNACFDFFLQIPTEMFLILKRTDRDVIKNVSGPHVTYPLILSNLSETYSNIKFHENSCNWSRVGTHIWSDRRREGHDEANRCVANLRTRLKTHWPQTDTTVKLLSPYTNLNQNKFDTSLTTMSA